MTAAEAGACGLPVIAFATGGLTEIVQAGQTGWSVPLENGAAGLSHSLMDAFKNAEKRRAHEPALRPAHPPRVRGQRLRAGPQRRGQSALHF